MWTTSLLKNVRLYRLPDKSLTYLPSSVVGAHSKLKLLAKQDGLNRIFGILQRKVQVVPLSRALHALSLCMQSDECHKPFVLPAQFEHYKSMWLVFSELGLLAVSASRD